MTGSRTTGARRKRTGAVAPVLTVVALLALLGGCGLPTSTPSLRPAAAVDAPALTSTQVTSVLAAVDAALAAGSGAALTARVDGAALALRQASATITAHVPSTTPPPALTGTLALQAVPDATTWPRWFLVVRRASATAAPQLLVLTQAGARADYHLSASATLLPGVTLPALARSRTGAVTSIPAAATLAGSTMPSPQDALARYADVLTNGSSSTWAASTATDALRTQVAAEQDAERTGVSTYDTYTATHTPHPGSVWALALDDGGELVLGVLDGARTFTPKGPGIDQQLTSDIAALAGRNDAPSGLVVSTAEVVVLHVPPTGSTTLVAAQRGLTGVKLG